MKVSDVGEFGLIGKIDEILGNTHLGDDAAAIDGGLYTTDMLVEGTHFIKERHPPFKLGRKALCSSVSDIAAMGGKAEYVLVSLAIPENAEILWVEELYRGMLDAASGCSAEIVGGDTVKADRTVISVSVTGRSTGNPVRRGGASAGDLVFVSGPLGASLAGLKALENGLTGHDSVVDKHLDPGCRADIGPEIGRFATAMIDISDGLVSELRHIADSSGVGMTVNAEAVPVREDAVAVAEKLGLDPLELALHSGEEYELLFTVPENMRKEARRFGVGIGRVTEDGLVLERDDTYEKMRGGWVHF